MKLSPVVIMLLCLGAAAGAGLTLYWQQSQQPISAQADPSSDPASLQREIASVRGSLPSQSHAMADVGYQYANLWFAGSQKNWPLAQFYLNETRSHIRWTIRLRPIRKDDDGKDVNLQAIFDGIDGNLFAAIAQAIEAKDSGKFDTTYKGGLEGCYACHKASSKPYLRPMIPQVAPQPIINFDPNAAWPK